jgi:hypothetical protein
MWKSDVSSDAWSELDIVKDDSVAKTLSFSREISYGPGFERGFLYDVLLRHQK